MNSASGGGFGPGGEAGAGAGARIRRWAARRGRQGLRAALMLAGLLAVLAVVAVIRRQAGLVGLPDPGDPPGLAAATPGPVPGGRDAFDLLRKAEAALRPWMEMPPAVLRASLDAGWEGADPGLRRWVEANRPALGLFREAAAQADGLAHRPGAESTFTSLFLNPGQFFWLAALEGSRLEGRGEAAAAWGLYRDALAVRAHLMRRGTTRDRWIAGTEAPTLLAAIARWAADPATGADELRRALADAQALGPRPGWDADSLRLDYALAMAEFDRPDGPLATGDEDERPYRIGGEDVPANLTHPLFLARRFLLAEPERSRRVARLVFANWIAHAEDPDAASRPPAVRVAYRRRAGTGGLPLFEPGPDAPAGARAMTPRDLAGWFLAAPAARWLFSEYPWPSIRLQERREHRELVVGLAGELHRRERGGPPPDDEVLVGTYLDRLPDDGSGELDDGSAAVIDEGLPALDSGPDDDED